MQNPGSLGYNIESLNIPAIPTFCSSSERCIPRYQAPAILDASIQLTFGSGLLPITAPQRVVRYLEEHCLLSNYQVQYMRLVVAPLLEPAAGSFPFE